MFSPTLLLWQKGGYHVRIAGAAEVTALAGFAFADDLPMPEQLVMVQQALLGRVTSGEGGAVIIDRAKAVLQAEFPGLATQLQLHIPDERSKRHGQTIAAASLPVLKKNPGPFSPFHEIIPSQG